MDNRKKGFAVAALRRASYRWPGRYQAMKDAHKGRNQYECAECKKIFTRKEVQLDHIESVVPINGFKNGEAFDFDEFIDRLLVDKEGFQVLCKEDHMIKTQAEQEIRKHQKKLKKTKKKK